MWFIITYVLKLISLFIKAAVKYDKIAEFDKSDKHSLKCVLNKTFKALTFKALYENCLTVDGAVLNYWHHLLVSNRGSRPSKSKDIIFLSSLKKVYVTK